MGSDGSDSFLVGYQRQLVACASFNDAVSLKRAGQILADPATPETSLHELLRLGELLLEYELCDDAERLRDLARRARALQFLVYSRGYVRPKRKAGSAHVAPL